VLLSLGVAVAACLVAEKTDSIRTSAAKIREFRLLGKHQQEKVIAAADIDANMDDSNPSEQQNQLKHFNSIVSPMAQK
jgi:hypothetical protein